MSVDTGWEVVPLNDTDRDEENRWVRLGAKARGISPEMFQRVGMHLVLTAMSDPEPRVREYAKHRIAYPDSDFL